MIPTLARNSPQRSPKLKKRLKRELEQRLEEFRIAKFYDIADAVNTTRAWSGKVKLLRDFWQTLRGFEGPWMVGRTPPALLRMRFSTY